VNWRDADNQALVIIGGDKAQQIQTHPTLSAYAQAFDERLTRPESKLMIIGYGFRDHHINRAIVRGVREQGLQFFVICPEGAKVAQTFRSEAHPGAALAAFEYDLEDVFARGCVGISTRMLRDIFGGLTAGLRITLQPTILLNIGIHSANHSSANFSGKTPDRLSWRKRSPIRFAPSSENIASSLALPPQNVSE
jgi:hypothetical protein